MKTIVEIKDEKKADKLAERMNILLANFQVFYQNLRGVHWNIRGENFFDLHNKFEELYTDAQQKIDEVAERILTMGYTPMHTYTDYVKNSDIKEGKDVSVDRETVELVLSGLDVLVEKEREALKIAEEGGDEGTVDMLGGYIAEYEKYGWMFNAWLYKKKH